MDHCKTKRNQCHGIMECFCECERCVEADDRAGELEAPAATEHFENLGDE